MSTGSNTTHIKEEASVIKSIYIQQQTMVYKVTSKNNGTTASLNIVQPFKNESNLCKKIERAERQRFRRKILKKLEVQNKVIETEIQPFRRYSAISETLVERCYWQTLEAGAVKLENLHSVSLAQEVISLNHNESDIGTIKFMMYSSLEEERLKEDLSRARKAIRKKLQTLEIDNACVNSVRIAKITVA
jgi:hypothetical protein